MDATNSHVIIVGQHSDDWNRALAPDSEAWRATGFAGSVSWCVPYSACFSLEGSRGNLNSSIVIPMLERDILACQGSNGLFASRAHVDIMSNKKAWARFLTSVNLSHCQPQYWTQLDHVTFPVFLKRLDLNAGHGIVRVPDRESLEAALNSDVFRNHEFLLQEAVDTGHDHVTHILASEGAILWSETFRYLAPPSAGAPFAGRGRPLIRLPLSPHELTVFQEIVKALSYSGIASLDWRMGTNGPKTLEANPRMGGSLMRPENTDILTSLLRAILAATKATPGYVPRCGVTDRV